MTMKFVAVVALLVASPAIAQDKTPPKASKADVQKVVDALKADKTKMAQFCDIMKLQEQYSQAAEKKDEKKLEELDKQMEESTKKIGADFDKVTASELDDESAALLDDLAKQCGK